VLSATERTLLYAALSLATVAAWSVTWIQSSDLSGWSPFLAQAWCGNAWTAASALSSLLMWISMMLAMMLPATAPVIDAYATIARKRRARREPYTPTLVFIGGYILVWSCFSAAAAFTQSQLYRAASFTPTTQNVSLLLAGMALLIAGLYQFTPVKAACLRGCRSPLAFIIAEWREGYAGALLMGLRHGVFCVGCCWASMSLMFCVSVMDMRWAAALAVYAAIEKIAPGGDTVIAPAFGSAAILGGVALLGMTLF
jgi:predicted metal-binding membrane protein